MKLYEIQPENQIDHNIYQTQLDGLLCLSQKQLPDERGFFVEVAHLDQIRQQSGLPFIVKQINHSRSEQRVVRGMHAEGWNKLVMVASGVALCVLADVRPNSATFGKTQAFLLGHGGQALTAGLFIPSGMANSICAIEGPVDYVYTVDTLYADRNKADDAAISVFDPDLNIQWPYTKEEMILSERDLSAITLREKYPEKFI